MLGTDQNAGEVTGTGWVMGFLWWVWVGLESSEISDLCEISDLLLFFSYFASQSKGTKFGV